LAEWQTSEQPNDGVRGKQRAGQVLAWKPLNRQKINFFI